MREALRYVLTLALSTVIVGCDTIAQLEENVAIAREFTPLSSDSLAALEKRAEPLHRQALEVTKKALGERHPSYATSLNNLATLYVRTGDFARAETLVRQALEITKRALGESHPNYGTSLNDLALLGCSTFSAAPAERRWATTAPASTWWAWTSGRSRTTRSSSTRPTR